MASSNAREKRMGQYPSQGIAMDLIAQFQALDPRFLLVLHHGDVDAVAVARRELAMRGVDGSGRWVGFAQAGERLGI
ncbi:hypothetical protein WMO32_06995 [Xanthomonas oryzae pv. oryzicola]|uniref:hypothetical protein n=1 Tax=Xanthomonas oryzae TaxID=347 RepID=UPI000AB26A36|nr:hypothetical protein [Xanthomonas oryzae]MEC5115776.1 hypothetical protein [Xanthomonas oryzae pv. oryzicola]